PTRRYLLEAGRDSVEEAGSVLLFSGGADSLCAAALEGERGSRPLVLSHAAATRSQPNLEKLGEALREAQLGWSFPHRFVKVTKRGVEGKERTQRSRGFLYSALGA